MTLVDEHGDAIDLHTERAGRPAVVVFHRSAQWCAFCRRQLAQFQAAQPAYAAAGIAVFAVSPDPVPRLSEFAAEASITFPLLADEGSRLIRRLGILNDLIEPHEPRYGIPFPGVYVLAADGTVVGKYFYQHYRERPHPLRILREVFGRSADEAGCIVATGHLGAVALRVTMLGRALTPSEHTLLLLRTDPPRAVRRHVDPDARIEFGASV
ncbi:MAG: peroxiredoxin family protein, partial [Dehalococcoidia bacterium]